MSLSATQAPLNNLGGFGSSAATPPAAKPGKTTGADSANLGGATTAEDQSNRFLKLLVAQMSNQDPLNPMDSAQVTSQMAQISTVEGVQTLNQTVSGLNAQFTQLQTMQGAALVGHDVATEGNSLRQNDGASKGDGGFELTAPATSVSVDVVNAAGQTVGTIKMGPQEAGRHSFDFDVPQSAQGQPLSFKINAMSNGVALDALPLAYNRIEAVSNVGGKLAVELDNGTRVSYDAVWAFL